MNKQWIRPPIEAAMDHMMYVHVNEQGKQQYQRAGPNLEYCIYPVRIWIGRTQKSIGRMQKQAWEKCKGGKK